MSIYNYDTATELFNKKYGTNNDVSWMKGLSPEEFAGATYGLAGSGTGVDSKRSFSGLFDDEAAGTKGFGSALLSGDKDALGLAGLGLKGLGMVSELAMLPGALENAKLTNKGLKLAVKEAEKDSANKAAIRQQLTRISV